LEVAAKAALAATKAYTAAATASRHASEAALDLANALVKAIESNAIESNAIEAIAPRADPRGGAGAGAGAGLAPGEEGAPAPRAFDSKESLPEWLEATLEVTGDPSDAVTQAEIAALARDRDPDKGWKYAGRHGAKKIIRFVREWCDSRGACSAEGDAYTAEIKGVVVRRSASEAAAAAAASAAAASAAAAAAKESEEAERYQRLACTSCGSADLLSRGICGACDASYRVKAGRVRVLFDENWLRYSSFCEGVAGGSRPDFVFEAATHFVVVEVDEDQHRAYPEEGERARMVSLSTSLGRPTVFVRYNPDAYAPGDGGRRLGNSSADGDSEEPLEVREKTLVYWVKRLLWTPRREEKPKACEKHCSSAEVLYLYFDGFVPGTEKPEPVAEPRYRFV
jgi:hypothetical protein